MAEGRIYVGMNGYVLCLDRADGHVVWSVDLPGISRSLVTVASDVDGVFASADGEVFRLDTERGSIVWHNKLKGYGVEFGTIALQRGDAYDLATAAVAAAAAKHRQQQASSSSSSAT